MMAEATHLALADAGLMLDQVDRASLAATAVHSMAAMSLSWVTWGSNPNSPAAPTSAAHPSCPHVIAAAMALEAGEIEVALIAYGSNQRSAGGVPDRQ